jgi:rare lipoprotein A
LTRVLCAVVLGCVLTCVQAQQDEVVAEFDAAVGSADAGLNGLGHRLETGIASWYGKRFHGRTTASGEAFDMHGLTAAHPKLPFGSWVRVRNMVNGLSVDVRINDRGPHIKRRVIDLSHGAAKALGLVQSGEGTKQVSITLLRR